jgi:hypothetical protein
LPVVEFFCQSDEVPQLPELQAKPR